MASFSRAAEFVNSSTIFADGISVVTGETTERVAGFVVSCSVVNASGDKEIGGIASGGSCTCNCGGVGVVAADAAAEATEMAEVVGDSDGVDDGAIDIGTGVVSRDSNKQSAGIGELFRTGDALACCITGGECCDCCIFIG